MRLKIVSREIGIKKALWNILTIISGLVALGKGTKCVDINNDLERSRYIF